MEKSGRDCPYNMHKALIKLFKEDKIVYRCIRCKALSPDDKHWRKSTLEEYYKYYSNYSDGLCKGCLKDLYHAKEVIES